jgi:hypothetical protein
MTEPNGPVTEPEPEVEPRRPLTAGQVVALCVAGSVGGCAGALCLGLVLALLGTGSAGGMLTDPSVGMHVWLGGMAGAALGMPLGVAVGLRTAGRKLGIHGRFRPALGWSFAGLLASLAPALFLPRLMVSGRMGMGTARYSLFFFLATPFALALAGGLIGYLRSRRPRPPASPSHPQ